MRRARSSRALRRSRPARSGAEGPRRRRARASRPSGSADALSASRATRATAAIWSSRRSDSVGRGGVEGDRLARSRGGQRQLRQHHDAGRRNAVGGGHLSDPRLDDPSGSPACVSASASWTRNGRQVGPRATTLAGRRRDDHRAVRTQEQRLGQRDALDLGGVHALVRRVDQAARLLDADQHDLGVRDRCRRGRCTAGSSRPGPRSSSAARTPRPSPPPSPRTPGRPVRPVNGSPSASRSTSTRASHGDARSQVRDERVLRLGGASMPGGTRRLMRARGRRLAPRPTSRPPAGSRCRARSPRAAPRACPATRAVADQVDAVEHVGVGAELLGRVLDAGPRLRRRRGRRRGVAVARRAASRASRISASSASGAAPPNMPECIALPSASTRDDDVRSCPRSVVGERRHADARSCPCRRRGSRRRAAGRRCSGTNASRPPVPCSSEPSRDQLDADTGSRRRRAARAAR